MSESDIHIENGNLFHLGNNEVQRILTIVQKDVSVVILDSNAIFISKLCTY
jgi:hypothetical protein